MSKLARRAVLALTTGVDTRPHEFETARIRFMDLPKELRLHVLSFTDFVAPYCQIEWNSTSAGYYVSYPVGYWHPDHSWTGDIRTARYSKCWEETEYQGYFCQAQHAAFSSIYECKCWTRPQSLFLVSREFCTDARRLSPSQSLRHCTKGRKALVRY